MATEMHAPVTGKVWKIEVAVGETVDEGDDLIILESMKMEIPVVAETDCIIDEVRFAEGDSVEEGQVLIVVSER